MQALRRALRSPWAHLVIAFLVFGLVQAVFVKVFSVPSGSMQTTLEVGDRILVDRTAGWFGRHPQRGDVIVFTTDDDWEAATTATPVWKAVIKGTLGAFGYGPGNAHHLVKRVIATGGDTVSCCDADGHLQVNGEALDEPYVYDDLPFTAGVLDCDTTPRSRRCLPEITVPEGSLLVLGDHRSVSSDSVIACRGLTDADPAADGCARFADERDVVGHVVAIAWPLSRLSGAP